MKHRNYLPHNLQQIAENTVQLKKNGIIQKALTTTLTINKILLFE